MGKKKKQQKKNLFSNNWSNQLSVISILVSAWAAYTAFNIGKNQLEMEYIKASPKFIIVQKHQKKLAHNGYAGTFFSITRNDAIISELSIDVRSIANVKVSQVVDTVYRSDSDSERKSSKTEYSIRINKEYLTSYPVFEIADAKSLELQKEILLTSFPFSVGEFSKDSLVYNYNLGYVNRIESALMYGNPIKKHNDFIIEIDFDVYFKINYLDLMEKNHTEFYKSKVEIYSGIGLYYDNLELKPDIIAQRIEETNYPELSYSKSSFSIHSYEDLGVFIVPNFIESQEMYEVLHEEICQDINVLDLTFQEVYEKNKKILNFIEL